MNAPIYSFTVGGYDMSLIIKGFEHDDYNTKRVQFKLIRVHQLKGMTQEEVTAIIKYPYSHPLTIKDKGAYHVIPVSGKLSVLQHQFSFSARRSDNVPRYVKEHIKPGTALNPPKIKRVTR